MKTTTRQIIGYFGIYFFLGAANAILGPALPSLAANIGVGLAQAGVLITLRSFGFLTGALIYGRLFDSLPGNRILGISLLLLSGLHFFIPGISIFIAIGILIFLVGFIVGGMDVGANIMLIHTDAAGKQGLINGMFFTAGVGGFLAPVFLGYTSIPIGFSGVAIIMIPVAAWLLLTPSPKVGHHEEASGSDGWDPVVFWLFAALTFCVIGLEVGYAGWIFTYFSQKAFGGESQAYLVTSAFWLAITLGRLGTILISSRVKAPQRIFSYFSLGLVSMLLTLLGLNSPVMVWVGTIGMGLGLSSLFPSLIGYLQEKSRLSGSKSGIVWSFGSFGAMLIPWLIGQGIEGIGPDTMMFIAAFAIAMGFVLFTLIYNRIKLSSHQADQST